MPELLEPQLVVKGDGTHLSTYTLSGRYFGGGEGDSEIVWRRAASRSDEYEEIPETRFHKTHYVRHFSFVLCASVFLTRV
jgi:hypothetical protein